MQKLTTVFVLFAAASSLNAATISINVQNFSFSPNAVTANVGDSIKWVWVSGFHTTTSLTIPGGSPWNSNINSTTTQFIYVLTAAGTYTYECSPHGFTGTINALAVGTTQALPKKGEELFYPNPFFSKLSLLYSDADRIEIFDLPGNKVKEIVLSVSESKAVFDLGALPPGVYFFRILKEGEIISTKKIVKA